LPHRICPTRPAACSSTRNKWPHESARTKKLYDRQNDKVALDESERIVL
jgi:hypothetical protein